MHGLVFEIFEDWVIETHGLKAWHTIKKNAGCDVKDKSFVTRTFYNYDIWVKLITAAATELEISFDNVLETYGHYNIRYHFSHGHDALLRCQGSTLRQWLSNLNAMHDHVQKSFPGENFCPPVFWCEDCDTVEGSILLHYFSQRGNLLVPWVVGIVEELASFHFEVEVKMNQIAKQDTEGSKFTTWRITAVDENQMWKLSPKSVEHKNDEVVDFSSVQMPSKCPFTGKKLRKDMDEEENMCPHAKRELERIKEAATASLSTSESSNSLSEHGDESGLTMGKMKEVFPFHVMVNKDFQIAQVGEKLPKLLKAKSHDLIGVHIKEIFMITRPVLGSSWDWVSLNKLSDQNFFLAPVNDDTNNSSNTRASTYVTPDGKQKFRIDGGAIKFKASIVHLADDKVMFTLSPEARNVEDLNNMGLTLSDLPLQSCQRDAVFLGEYITQEADKAHGLDKLSRKLGAEQALSNTLLYNILPRQVADDLRKGKTIEPKFHENVTLFFSDVVGFTDLCGQVEPWDVIDMMNQLYSVMDFLADKFNLYKVETVGDSYMCCSGLPEPDEYHAENVANFALAVLECVKHVKSPITGEPIELRIGIHTGSCTSGVVGTLTPHYCLFGDMVNFTSRHESTGVQGKIHCSSVLYGRLTHFAQSDSPEYRFKARGLVDMKGKGEHYTYWLESGTESNDQASPEALQALSEEVGAMISSKKWKMRKYFRHGGLFANDDKETTGSTSAGSGYHSQSDSANDGTDDDGELSVHSDDRDIVDDIEDDKVEDDIVNSVRIENLTEELDSFGKTKWEVLHWTDCSKAALQGKIFEILSKILQGCVGKGGARLQTMTAQLEKYVEAIAGLYKEDNPFHSFTLAAEVVLRADYIWENWASDLSTDPWDHFMLLFAALIHGAQHTGIDNSQLEAENDMICSMYRGKQAYQQRNAFDVSFETLEEDFEELYEEIVFGCPNFRASVKKLVVNFTDLESEEKLRATIANFEKIIAKVSKASRVLKEQREAKIGLILAMATVGHYAQSYGMFLKWNNLNFQEHIKAYRSGRSEDPRESWYYEQNMFFSDAMMPLINQIERVLPKATRLGDCVLHNIEQWRGNGRDRLAASLVSSATVVNCRGESLTLDRMGALIAANVDMLEGLLKDLVACHKENKVRVSKQESCRRMSMPVEEIQMSIAMKTKTTTDQYRPAPDLPPHVRSELRDFVITVASGYESNDFHNFQHASHVAHLSHLLVNGINGIDGSNDGSGIACDPLARFAIVLSALVHDVGHTGVPNKQLAEENPELADKYSNKSIAEQNSIDVAWDMLNSEKFQNLQHCIYEDEEERERLRKLLVNCVMATDIFDQDLRTIRKTRWDKVYSDNEKLHSPEEEEHLKSTIVIEHIMQAADVAHTMQDWELYRQWNESLFLEFYQAFLDGRSDKDPSGNWYNGELWFFDNWVVPLASNLKTCGVLDIVSSQLVEQAHSNRRKWELEGQAICDAMLASANARNATRSTRGSRSVGSIRSTESEIMLTSKMVNEVETLSKVVRRYEKKMQAACGNLIAVAYKGHSEGNELKKKKWSDIHSHFKQQDWYKMYSDDEFSVDECSLNDNKSSSRRSGRKGATRTVSFSKSSSDDVSSVGSSLSGMQSQLLTAERIIAKQFIASSKAA